jgi:hypothetical protein
MKPSLKCRFQLQIDKVVGVIKPAPALLVDGFEPPRSNQHDHHRTFADGLQQFDFEVDSWIDGINVDEDSLLADMIDEAIGESPCDVSGVLAAITQEDVGGVVHLTTPFAVDRQVQQPAKPDATPGTLSSSRPEMRLVPVSLVDRIAGGAP